MYEQDSNQEKQICLVKFEESRKNTIAIHNNFAVLSNITSNSRNSSI